jgi:cell cycle protein kinase DBF2
MMASKPNPSIKTTRIPVHNDASSRDIHMDTAKGLPPSGLASARLPHTGLPDIGITNVSLNDDITMATARGGATTMKAGGLQLWERELLDCPEVKRKATVAQLCTRSLTTMNRRCH